MLKKFITASLLTAMILSSGVNAAVSTPAVEEPVMPDIEIMPEEIIAGSPISAAAPMSDEEGLKKAILRFKEIFGDTDEYDEFYSYINTNDDYKVKEFSLEWAKNSEDDYKSLSAVVGSDDVLYSYYSNTDYDSSKPVIPALIPDEAIDKALEFINKVEPELTKELSKDFVNLSYDKYGTYNITFYRIVNGRLVGNDSLSISVIQDGTITRYNRNFANNVSLPSETAELEKNAVIKAFADNMPFKLIYRTVYPDGYDNKAKIALYYAPDNAMLRNNIITAAKGELYKLKHIGEYYYTAASNYAYDAAAETKEAAPMTGSGYKLSEAELKAVEMQASFITVEEAVNIIKSIPEFFIYEDAIVSGSNLRMSESAYTEAETYYWDIKFKSQIEKDEKAYSSDYTYFNAGVNAETGEVMYYSSNKYDYKNASDFKYSLDECRNAANEFLKKYYPALAESYRIDESEDTYKYLLNNDSYISDYNFSYVRYVNDIPFSENTAFLRIDPDTLKVLDINYKYADADFVSPAKAISADKAMEKYWSQCELEPFYMVNYGIKDGEILVPNYSGAYDDKQLTLVYKMQEFCYIDAFKGNLDNYSGNKYIPHKTQYYKSVPFSDIDRSPYKDAITMLVYMNIIKQDEMFKPEARITENELVKMMQNVKYTYIKNSEYTDDPISRENAVKRMIELMGYKDIAELKGIFKLDLKDIDSVKSENFGYVAIAKGLSIIDIFGDTFNPSKLLTKGEAAAMVYAYLTFLAE